MTDVASDGRPEIFAETDHERFAELVANKEIQVVDHRDLLAAALREATEETGLTVDSKAQAEQVRSVDVDRLVARLGRLDADQRDEVDQALLLHLGLQH